MANLEKLCNNQEDIKLCATQKFETCKSSTTEMTQHLTKLIENGLLEVCKRVKSYEWLFTKSRVKRETIYDTSVFFNGKYRDEFYNYLNALMKKIDDDVGKISKKLLDETPKIIDPLLKSITGTDGATKQIIVSLLITSYKVVL